jgi:hypothetical protein
MFERVRSERDGPLTDRLLAFVADRRAPVRPLSTGWPSVADAAESALSDADPQVRRSAARLLVHLAGPDRAVAALDAPADPVVRIALTRAMLRSEAPRYRASLDRLRSDRVPAVRLLAGIATYGRDDPAARPSLDVAIRADLEASIGGPARSTAPTGPRPAAPGRDGWPGRPRARRSGSKESGWQSRRCVRGGRRPADTDAGGRRAGAHRRLEGAENDTPDLTFHVLEQIGPAGAAAVPGLRRYGATSALLAITEDRDVAERYLAGRPEKPRPDRLAAKLLTWLAEHGGLAADQHRQLRSLFRTPGFTQVESAGAMSLREGPAVAAELLAELPDDLYGPTVLRALAAMGPHARRFSTGWTGSSPHRAGWGSTSATTTPRCARTRRCSPRRSRRERIAGVTPGGRPERSTGP